MYLQSSLDHLKSSWNVSHIGGSQFHLFAMSSMTCLKPAHFPLAGVTEQLNYDSRIWLIENAKMMF